MMLLPPADRPDLDQDTPSIAGAAEAAALLGHVGVALSMLRPAGMAKFGDSYVDVVTEGDSLNLAPPFRSWRSKVTVLSSSGCKKTVWPRNCMDPLTLAYILIAIGVVLLIAELFIPTGEDCFIIAMGCFLGGIAVSFVYGDNRTGITTLIIVFVIVPVILMAWFWLWPESMWGSRLKPNYDDNATVAAMPGNASLEQLRGRIGKTVSTFGPPVLPNSTASGSIACRKE